MRASESIDVLAGDVRILPILFDDNNYEQAITKKEATLCAYHFLSAKYMLKGDEPFERLGFSNHYNFLVSFLPHHSFVHSKLLSLDSLYIDLFGVRPREDYPEYLLN